MKCSMSMEEYKRGKFLNLTIDFKKVEEGRKKGRREVSLYSRKAYVIFPKV